MQLYTQLSLQKINTYRTANNLVFSHQNKVYASVGSLWEIIKKIAEKYDATDEFIFESFQEKAWVIIQWIYNLEDCDAVSFDDNLPGRAGSPYRLKNKGEDGSQSHYFVVLHAQIFAMDFEKSETAKPIKLKNIQSVKPDWIQ